MVRRQRNIGMMFIIARNRTGRPTLQHILGAMSDQTVCGLNVWEWSRAYQSEMIPEIICKRCKNHI